MSDPASRALSFGEAAEDYDRYRPGPVPAAVDWLLPQGAVHVLDLAAGTGACSRLLIERVEQVSAVEPDERMRRVLARRCPRVRALAGSGERIPLPDACVDAVLVSSAWQWLDPARAVPEIARVLRPGGRLGVLWTRRDDEVAWVAELDAFARTLLPARAGAFDTRRFGEHHRVLLGEGAPFGDVAERVIRGEVERSPAEVAAAYTTYSGFMTLPEQRRRQVRERIEQRLRCHPALAGATRIGVPLRCVCWRATYTGADQPGD